MQTNPTMQTKPTKKIARILARHLREKARANKHYAKADAVLQAAIAAGLQANDPVEVSYTDTEGVHQQERYYLANNFASDTAYRATRIPHYELKRVPKRGLQSNESITPKAEVGA